MAEKKSGFFKRLFKFGKKDAEIEEVQDATSDTALGLKGGEPIAHAEAAANSIVDTEAGADLDAEPGIVPLDKVEDAPSKDDIDHQAIADRAAQEAEDRRAALETAEKAEFENAEKAKAEAKQKADAAAEKEARKVAEEKREQEALAAEQAQQAEREAQEAMRLQQEAEHKKREAEAEKAEVKRLELARQKEQAEAEAAQVKVEQEARQAKEAKAEEAQNKLKQDGVIGAPGETNIEHHEDTPEPLSDTPEPKLKPKPAQPEPVQDQGSGEPKRTWFNRLTGGLSRSSSQLTQNITSVFTKRKLDEETLQELEDILIQADLGVETAMNVTDSLARQRMGKDVSDVEVREIMAAEIEKTLQPVAAELELDLDHTPHVILVVGVNGSGKTTTIGKLSQKLYDAGFSTLLVAGDTFRAAAIEQLKIWGERTQSPVVYRPIGADAAGLAYDAYVQSVEEGRDVMLMDTAGRLQNKTELMDELEKIIRVMRKQDPTAPHTVLLTLDATTGQNALNQVEIFKNVAGVNGLVMTKLDGTARGGIMVSIAAKYKLPVYFIGVGEQVDDLEPFEARDFARSIAGLNQ